MPGECRAKGGLALAGRTTWSKPTVHTGPAGLLGAYRSCAGRCSSIRDRQTFPLLEGSVEHAGSPGASAP